MLPEHILRSAQSLAEQMRESEIYQRYLELEQEIGMHPDLKSRVDAYRRKLYGVQTSSALPADMEEELDRELTSLSAFPYVREYLETEVSVCRMMQRVMSKISERVTIDLPM